MKGERHPISSMKASGLAQGPHLERRARVDARIHDLRHSTRTLRKLTQFAGRAGACSAIPTPGKSTATFYSCDRRGRALGGRTETHGARETAPPPAKLVNDGGE